MRTSKERCTASSGAFLPHLREGWGLREPRLAWSKRRFPEGSVDHPRGVDLRARRPSDTQSCVASRRRNPIGRGGGGSDDEEESVLGEVAQRAALQGPRQQLAGVLQQQHPHGGSERRGVEGEVALVSPPFLLASPPHGSCPLHQPLQRWPSRSHEGVGVHIHVERVGAPLDEQACNVNSKSTSESGG